MTEALERVTAGHTTVVIAHRLSTASATSRLPLIVAAWCLVLTAKLNSLATPLPPRRFSARTASASWSAAA